MELKMKIPLPHGGRLVDRVVTNPRAGKKMAATADAAYDIKPTLYNGMPVRNVYREIMSICYGFFSPCEGSMTKAELERILKERRLLSNWVFPYPMLFDISEEDLKKLKVQEGDTAPQTEGTALRRPRYRGDLPDRSQGPGDPDLRHPAGEPRGGEGCLRQQASGL